MVKNHLDLCVNFLKQSYHEERTSQLRKFFRRHVRLKNQNFLFCLVFALTIVSPYVLAPLILSKPLLWTLLVSGISLFSLAILIINRFLKIKSSQLLKNTIQKNYEKALMFILPANALLIKNNIKEVLMNSANQDNLELIKNQCLILVQQEEFKTYLALIERKKMQPSQSKKLESIELNYLNEAYIKNIETKDELSIHLTNLFMLLFSEASRLHYQIGVQDEGYINEEALSIIQKNALLVFEDFSSLKKIA